MERVNLREKFAAIPAYWQPRLAARVNETDVKLARLKGEFVWHRHAEQDELFLVVAGRLCIEFRDRSVWLEAGELLVVPRGVEHRPVAPEEVHVLLVEPRGTLNTGDVRNELTLPEIERI